MSEVQVTNGTIKYGETRKIADYENKTGHVELSFNIAEGQDPHEAIETVHMMAKEHLHAMLHGTKRSDVSPAKEPTAAKAPAAKAVKATAKPAANPVAEQPAAKPTVDPAAVSDNMPPVPAALRREKPAAATVEEPTAVSAEEEDIDALLGLGDAPAAKEITDKELTDATQKCQSANKNAPAIHKAIRECGVKSPPGRIIDIPQDKRQTYLDLLKEIKPLA